MKSIIRTFRFIHSHPLAKKHKLLAIKNFTFWQLKSRFYPGFIKIPFIENTFVWARRGLTGITGNIYTGLHEFQDMFFLLHFLKESDMFFDVGANVGSYTILASGVKKAKTISFEPIPGTFQILQKNIELNNLSSLVILENIGVGAKQGYLHFTTNQDTSNHIISENEKNNESTAIPVCNLDSFYPEFTPALLKIDVEGFETEVLNGAMNLLKDPNLKAIIIELNGSGGRYGYNEINIHNKLLGLSFRPYTYDPFKRALTLLSNYGNLNTIYLRDERSVKNRIGSSRKILVFNEEI